MILECPTCRTRYLVQIGLFAQGGRKVRCARCKNEWHASLPTSVDVIAPPPEIQIPEAPLSPADQLRRLERESKAARPSEAVVRNLPDIPGFMAQPSVNLPAVIKKERFADKAVFFVAAGVLLAALWMGSAVGRVFVGAAHTSEEAPWKGLVFRDVKSELKYDSGTMKLFVDGAIYNETEKKKAIPDIRAKALGPDRRTVQSWQVDSPAPELEPGKSVPFHTEVSTPMERTIEDVSLDFVARKKHAR
ncbi:MAG: zinc-ribbon domain-containing protein [Alphaproteobacteria bacterium]|nr:zinc-ribbon domain-containing protein [Alphaproteobacteria bacterium]